MKPRESTEITPKFFLTLRWVIPTLGCNQRQAAPGTRDTPVPGGLLEDCWREVEGDGHEEDLVRGGVAGLGGEVVVPSSRSQQPIASQAGQGLS